MECGMFFFFKKAAAPSEKTERVMEVEGRSRYRIYIKLFNKHCIQVPLPLSGFYTHAHTFTRTQVSPRWVVDKGRRTVVSRHTGG